MINKINQLNKELFGLQEKKDATGLTPEELFIYHDLTAQVQKLASDYFLQKEESYLSCHEQDNTVVKSNVKLDVGRSCSFCHKEEFLFTAQDEKMMNRYGCCKKCFCLFVE